MILRKPCLVKCSVCAVRPIMMRVEYIEKLMVFRFLSVFVKV